MAQIDLELHAGETITSGTATAEVGATSTIRFTDGAVGKFSVDYRTPDQLIVLLSGEFSLVQDKVIISPSISDQIGTGQVSVGASLVWKIDKSVDVTIDTSLGSADGLSAGASITIRFN